VASAEEGAVAVSEHERIAAPSTIAAEPDFRRLKTRELLVERPIVVSHWGGYVLDDQPAQAQQQLGPAEQA
jgi:hypothetical protein